MVGIFKWPLVVFFVLLGIGLAFVPVQDRGMDEWVINFINAMFLPTQRVWRKEPMIPQAFLYQSIDVVKQELITLAPTSSRRKLEKYLDYGIQEKEEDPLDIPEEAYIMKVKKAFSAPSYVQAQQVGVAVKTEQPAPAPPAVSATQPVPAKPVAGGPEPSGAQPPAEAKPEPTKAQPPEHPPEVRQPPEAVQPQPAQVSEKEELKEEVEAKQAVSQTPQAAHPSPLPPPPEEHKEEPVIPVGLSPEEQAQARIQQQAQGAQPTQPVQAPQPSQAAPLQRPAPPASSKPGTEFVTVNLITPDRHSGRRFTQLLPQEGDIFLPIRGEKVLKTSEQVEIEEDVKAKAEKLQLLLDQIKRGGTAAPAEEPKVAAPPKSPEDKEREQLGLEAKEAANRLKGENEKLASEIDKLKENISKSTVAEAVKKEGLIEKLEVQRGKAQEDYEKLHQQVAELQERLKKQQEVETTGGAPASVRDYQVAAKHLTGKPNVVSGVVKDMQGTVLDGILLIVKDNRGDPVRAFKTNKLGEFILATPLDNGMYTLEVSSVNDTPLSFDIISVEARGEVIPPIEIVGT
jgi:hypothetical protein